MSTHETSFPRGNAKTGRAHPAPNNAGTILLLVLVLMVLGAGLAFGAPAFHGMRAQAGCAAEIAAASQSGCAP